MPKIIENLDKRIVAAARKAWKEKGYDGPKVSDGAAECDIALDTMCNCYRSKDMLVGRIIADDWICVLGSMDKSIAEARSVHDGLSSIARNLEAFCDRYTAVWAEYGSQSGAGYNYAERHVVLVKAISERVEYVLRRFGKECDEKLCTVYSEALISMANHRLKYEEHSHILERMIK